MQGTLGADLVATLIAPGVLPEAQMGARIEVPYTRQIVSYWRPAAYDEVTGLWTVVLDSPITYGEYNLVWRTGDPEPPEMEVFIPLAVIASTAPAAPLPDGSYPWAPSVEDVAAVVPAYTVGGFDDDRESSGSQQGGFTEDTEPTKTHVEGLIKAACEEVQGRVGVAVPTAQYGLAKATAKWHVAAMIAAGKVPAGTDDASGEYRSHISNFRSSLDSLIQLARPGASRLR